MNDEPDPEQTETEPAEESGPSGETPAEEDALDERERELDKRQRRLNERELGLDKRADDLDERERALDEREQELDELQEELEQRRQEIQDKESSLNQFQEELDERENDLEEFEAELSDRATELGEHEETLNRYLEGQVEDLEESIQQTIRSALGSYEKSREPGRFGPTGNLLVGFAGLVLVAAGVGYAAWIALNATAGLFQAAVADFAVAAVLLIVGLAVNLATAADRI